jgi:hypothetical protein
MNRRAACFVVLTLSQLSGPAPATVAEEPSQALTVHLAAAGSRSPFAFVRARFEPGETTDPWAVRFFKDDGTEIPYFVWDSVTWHVAAAGRDDWGQRYALLNHAPGDDPGVRSARDRKIAWALAQALALGRKLAAGRAAAARAGDSVCAALYLLQHSAPPFGKERITLRIYRTRQIEPTRTVWTEQDRARPIAVVQGELGFHDLPDRLRITWRGKDLFRYAGFDAGETAGTTAHADPTRPFVVEGTAGIITRLDIRGQTPGRAGGDMDWQCTYWLCPQGAYTALEGYSLSNTDRYIGGTQAMSVWQGAGAEVLQEVQPPRWESPWWLHTIGQRGAVATHLFHSTPLAVGYGNNPFTVNALAPPGRAATMEPRGDAVALRWSYALDELAVARVFAPALYDRLGHGFAPRPEEALGWLDNNRAVVTSGKVGTWPEWMNAEAKEFVEDQLKLVRWHPGVDWFYRQYAVGVGSNANAAAGALGAVLGAAAGWIDRPFGEEEVAALLVQAAQQLSAAAAPKWSREMEILPALLRPDPAGVKQALGRWPDQVAATNEQVRRMETNRALGGNLLDGKTSKDGQRGEGWIVNPSYHATTLPYNCRFLEHFDLPHPEAAYRDALLGYADYSLDLLGGKPLDLDRLRHSYRAHWPSRFVAVIPLMLAAHDIKPDPRYARAATLMFDVLMKMVERNPQGYWSAWAAVPQKWEPFDTVYNAAGCERGLPAFWADGKLDLIGRERAARFVAAQARYLVFSGQLLDTLEVDNVTAAYATKHGGHPAERKQMPLFLFDDFAFYRGLFGNLAEWSAATPPHVRGPGDAAGGLADRDLGLAESGCYLLRWALGIGPGSSAGKPARSKWFEYRLEPSADKTGFRLQLWNRLPWTEPTLALGTRDVGLTATSGSGKGNVQRPLLWLRCSLPAYREPLVVDVQSRTPEPITIQVNRPVRLRLHYTALRPELEGKRTPTFGIRRDDGSLEPLPQRTNHDMLWGSGALEWAAEPGRYELQMR